MKAIFYATSTGNTQEVAEKLNERFDDFELVDISSDGVEKMQECNSIIIGASTWGMGELQDDWEDCFEEFQDIDFSGKTVALFGLGDQESYGDEFADALGILHEVVAAKGAFIIGQTSTDGYEYEDSKAEVDGKFVGLVIDEDNQSDLTDDRIESWYQSIRNEI